MKRPTPISRQRGATLLEVLVAVLVLAIGLLGVAALQASALRSNQSAFERSQAVMMSYSMLDAMRSNANVARTGGYNIGFTCDPPGGGGRVGDDIQRWITGLQAGLGAGTCGRIQCGANTCDIEVRWDDSRALDGDAEQTLTTTTRL